MADHLKVDEATVPTIVLTFSASAEAENTTAEAVAMRSRAVRALALHTELHLPGCLVGSIDQQVYLLHADPALTAQSVDNLLDRLVQQVERGTGVTALATAGRVHRGVGAAEQSRGEADDAMRVLRGRATDVRTGTFDRLRAAIVVSEVVEALRGRPTLVQGVIAPLIDQDRQRGTDYVHTLSVYLDAFGDVRKAAATLHVHPNSLRYRIRRIEEVAGLDLTDPELRLALQLVIAARGPRPFPEPGDDAGTPRI
ncbi:helix-turn-helix domain-containing protein [Pseudonocardia sp. DR1-2]|uniref:PucR family transcriptional regulator n=1 Tax=Pseudonocardia sp. DR1-2 TaxID=2951168 RepID=UPI002043DB07|nr:helix-turn-helix domain-containing protein [Pseudonocardia sp. DR1-2]MCM3849000.1 helix-turn-helix domain-containing protein [Pseudonocardia sp. DR1-2]